MWGKLRPTQALIKFVSVVETTPYSLHPRTSLSQYAFCSSSATSYADGLAKQVNTKGAAGSVSTDGLAKGAVQVVLVRGSVRGAERNRVNDAESKSL
jgi:hypothetical protein